MTDISYELSIESVTFTVQNETHLSLLPIFNALDISCKVLLTGRYKFQIDEINKNLNGNKLNEIMSVESNNDWGLPYRMVNKIIIFILFISSFKNIDRSDGVLIIDPNALQGPILQILNYIKTKKWKLPTPIERTTWKTMKKVVSDAYK